MLLYRRFLRALGVAAVAGLALGLACSGHKSGSSSSSQFTLSGNVTYTRIPLAKDANGVPTGLVDSTVASNLQTLPARGVQVRAYVRNDQTLADGTTTSVWQVIQTTYTDTSGNYQMTLAMDKPVMVELLSSFSGGDGHLINLIADPAGIGSSVPAGDRLRYALRKGVDGSAPAGNPTPSALPTGPATVNFTVGLADKWWLVNPNYNIQTLVASQATQAIDETTLPGRTLGTGSRVLAIGDSIATFVATYGRATPGQTLDLHYAPGLSDPRGSFIEYNPSVYPLDNALDPGTFIFTQHYFGSLQGGVNDDAWDESVIFRLLARSFLYSGNLGRTFGIPTNPIYPQAAALTDLSPELALTEGLADGMAANLLRSPYLADTQGTSLAAPVMDVRDISTLTTSQLSPDSAPAIRALTWALILKANSLTAPGTPSDWG
ncbi:MAG TPA: hypothetical protein VF768_08040, partial [Holophagaceae bacterium]